MCEPGGGICKVFFMFRTMDDKWYRVPVPNFSNENIFGTDLTLVLVVTCVVIASGVLGNAKGAVAVVVSILIFKNPVSVTGMLGIC
ncbi:hypothetical protein Hdeb2414_s0015g00442991 [Helianthus debilis subsp. tardiflorus]